MRLLLAFRVFFLVLFNREFADRIAQVAASPAEAPAPGASPQATAAKSTRPAPPSRDHAITLLATLQREARFVDIVMEPLGDYSDSQIGAAARDVLRDCHKVLQRLFDLKPILDVEDGEDCETPKDLDPGRYNVTGNVQGNPPFKGKLVHHGWEAQLCELPKWSGGTQAVRVVAPAEVEV